MDSVTSSYGREAVPLLAFRITDFQRVAWRDGKRAATRLERRTTRVFAREARNCVRAGDAMCHEPGSDVYTILMNAPSRRERPPSALDCRAVVERIVRALTQATGLAVESGWVAVPAGADRARAVESALERGARERERYEFFAAAGHELRTPLTSIRGYLETLLESELDRITARRFLEIARSEALRMGRLLERMFAFSMLDLSALTVGSASCDLRAQAAAACEILLPAARKRRITLDCRARGPVHAPLEADVCLQMLVNLLDNAVKHGRPGGCVRISAYRRGGEIIVSVEDDGPGVADGERDAVFGLRVRGTQAAAPGMGIGLAIVKMIAASAGGRTACSASPLGGAKFAVVLPARAESGAVVS
jgi:signal transduction histidine kinase